MSMSKGGRIFSWIGALVVALIYLQTLYFKFTGAPETIEIFTQLNGAENEALGRIGSGIAELIVAILILVPRTRIYGAIASIAVIGGAIFSHLTVLGIVVNEDGGSLFGLAVLILLLSVAVAYFHRSEIPFVGKTT